LRTLHEVSEDGGSRTYYGEEPPSLVNVPGITAKYQNNIAISPFILDELKENLRTEIRKGLSDVLSKVDGALVSLRNELWPKCELKYVQMEEDKALWAWDSENNPRLYIYLVPWLTGDNIRHGLCSHLDLRDRQSTMIITRYQSLPSIKATLEKWLFSYSSSIPASVLLINEQGVQYEVVKGEEHPYTQQIVNAIEKAASGLPVPSKKEERREKKEKAEVEEKSKGEGALKILLGGNDSGQVFWQPSSERSWNFVIVGSAGTGKTQTVKAIVVELAKLGLPYIVFDFRNDYISVETKTSDFGEVLDLRSMSINPLELDGTNSPKDQKYQISDIIDLVYNIGERQTGYIRDAIKMSYEDSGIYEDNRDTWQNNPPTFNDIERNLNRLSEEGSRVEENSIKGIFARLDPIFDYGIFSTKTVMPFEQIMKSRTAVDLGVLPNDKLKAVVCEFLQRKLRYYLYGLPESREPRLYVIIDEAHRLKYEKGSSTGQLLKKARKYGVGLILSTQDPIDFPDLVYNNIGGILSLQLTDPKYAKSVAEHLGGAVSWQNIKNDLSAKFSAYAKFSSQKDVVKLMVIPYYKRKERR